MRLAGKKDLSAPELYAGHCFLFAAYGPRLFRDASCQTPGKAAHSIHSGGDPQASLVVLMPPTSALPNVAIPANRVEDFHLNKWVGLGKSKPSFPPEGAQTRCNGVAILCPAFPLLLGVGLWEVHRTSHRDLGDSRVCVLPATMAHGFPCWFFLLCDLNCPLMLPL